ncbi:hypothetical protein M0812_08932 [Anaeramoeba flamelloides]|uniref:Uncharacterized protein n=1 Tax=Anaeramoeba flamelloides TaxID=1746091 RepID=A0AAV7ZM54_9EUKA|nr:hypothetical protein M0812_08932 [Anaeramoeba flamelloides]
MREELKESREELSKLNDKKEKLHDKKERSERELNNIFFQIDKEKQEHFFKDYKQLKELIKKGQGRFDDEVRDYLKKMEKLLDEQTLNAIFSLMQEQNKLSKKIKEQEKQIDNNEKQILEKKKEIKEREKYIKKKKKK